MLVAEWHYRRFFAKALPEGLFKYDSKSNAFCLLVNAIAVIICQGLVFSCVGVLIGIVGFKAFFDIRYYSNIFPIRCSTRSLMLRSSDILLFIRFIIVLTVL
jgi:hypothetical protein